MARERMPGHRRRADLPRDAPELPREPGLRRDHLLLGPAGAEAHVRAPLRPGGPRRLDDGRDGPGGPQEDPQGQPEPARGAHDGLLLVGAHGHGDRAPRRRVPHEALQARRSRRDHPSAPPSPLARPAALPGRGARRAHGQVLAAHRRRRPAVTASSSTTCSRPQGFEALVANDGLHAWALLQAHPEINLLILDVRMPAPRRRGAAQAGQGAQPRRPGHLHHRPRRREPPAAPGRRAGGLRGVPESPSAISSSCGSWRWPEQVRRARPS